MNYRFERPLECRSDNGSDWNKRVPIHIDRACDRNTDDGYGYETNLHRFVHVEPPSAQKTSRVRASEPMRFFISFPFGLLTAPSRNVNVLDQIIRPLRDLVRRDRR
jgi:hypothetical protein